MQVRTFRTALALALATALTLAATPGVSAASSGGDTRPSTSWDDFRANVQLAKKAKAGAAGDAGAMRPAAVTPADAFDDADDEIDYAVGIAAGSTADRDFSTAAPYPDVDWFSVPVVANHTYEITAIGLTGDPDPYVGFGPYDGFNVVNDDVRRQSFDPNSLIRYTVGATGTYYIAVADIGYPGGGSYRLSIQDMGVYTPGTSNRMGGADRYQVAYNVALAANGGTWAGIDTVIMASGLDAAAADPLTASSLAGVKNAPILLVNQASATKVLPTKTRAAISAIRSANPGVPVKYYLVGGTGSMPDWVRQRVLQLAPGSTFERLAGADRYACSARIAAEVRSETGGATTCFVANGETNGFFYNALAASPIAHGAGWPILLCKKNSIPGSTNTELANYANRFVVGNTYEVSTANVVTPIGATRIGETWSYYDRTLVARHVAEIALDRGWLGQTHVCVANKLADGLTGGTLAGSLSGPMLFVWDAGDISEHTESFVQQARLSLTDFYMIGGTASVNGDAEAQLLEITGHPGAWYTP